MCVRDNVCVDKEEGNDRDVQRRVGTLGKEGKQLSEYSSKTRRTIIGEIKKALLGDVKLSEILAPSCHPNLAFDAAATLSKSIVSRNELEKSTDAFERLVQTMLSTFFTQRENTNTKTPPKETYRILSLVAASELTLNDVNLLCEKAWPGDKIRQVSPWQWRCGRAYLKIWGAGAYHNGPKSKRNAYYKTSDLEFMIKSLYSKTYLQSVAYGTHDVRLSNGEFVSLPSLLRWFPHKRLYELYKAF